MRSGAVRIALIYVSIALLWITLSDRFLYLFHSTLSPEAYLLIGSLKGYLFALTNGFFLYKLIYAEEKKLTESSKKAIEYDDEVKRLGNIITRVNNIIIITDKNNAITWVNKAFEDFTGYYFEDVSGCAPATFFIDGETDMEAFKRVMRKKKTMQAFSGEVNCRKKNGTKFWVNGEYTPIFNDQKEFTGYIAVYNDITVLKQKEHETQQQNIKLKDVAWLCSHEIRRPVANIMGLISVMKTTPHVEDKIEIINDINQSAGELDKIIHTINSTIGIEAEPVEVK